MHLSVKIQQILMVFCIEYAVNPWSLQGLRPRTPTFDMGRGWSADVIILFFFSYGENLEDECVKVQQINFKGSLH